MITVVKIGGNVIDDSAALQAFLRDFTALTSPKILVHGGGKLATSLSRRLGIETQMVEGRRVTNRETLDVVTMTYAGLVNKGIVAQLQSLGCNAIGLSGADANVIPATRRQPVSMTTAEGEQKTVDFGYVGDIDATTINARFIGFLLDSGITPVFCALTHDGHGSMLNSNADSIAAAIATACAPSTLTYCFELDGVLGDTGDPDSVITQITPSSYEQLKREGIISKGMIPKLDNAFAALHAGVSRVIIKSYRNIANSSGTTITL